SQVLLPQAPPHNQRGLHRQQLHHRILLYIYFPTQNSLNTLSIISPDTLSPIIQPKSSYAEDKSTSQASIGMPASISFREASILALASFKSLSCLVLVIKTDSLFISLVSKISLMVSSNFFIPIWSTMEVFIIGRSRSKSFSLNLISRSALFKITMAFFSLIRSRIFLSSSSKSLDISKIARIRSDSSISSIDLSTPIFSTRSSVSLIPAVSFIFRVKSPREIYSVIRSLVVPGMSVTMALFSSKSTFKSEDLPTFGLPTILVFIPSFTSLPLLDVFAKSSILALAVFMKAVISDTGRSSPSSVKFIEYSRRARPSLRSVLISLIFLVREP